MEDQEELILVGENGEIPAGLPGSIMRKSMENKNLLEQKDSIYIGTGEKDADGIVITDVLKKGENGTVLNVVGGDLVYSKATPQMFVSGTYNIITTNALTFPTVATADFAPTAECANYYEGTKSKTIIDKFTELDNEIASVNSSVTGFENKWPTLPSNS